MQGVDIKGDVFVGANVLLYAALPALGAYVPDSAFLVAAASAACGNVGLLGCRVLDIGCGIGVTTAAIVKTHPKEIIAVDASPDMARLMSKVLLTDENIKNYLEDNDARTILGEGSNGLFEKAFFYLQYHRQDFQNGLVRNAEIRTKSGLEITREDSKGFVEAVIGSHYIHWPVNQLMSTGQTLGEACRQALNPLADLVSSGGIVALLTTDDFFTWDADPDFEKALAVSSLTNHPLVKKAHHALSNVLLERHGIEHKPPVRTHLFKKSQVRNLFRVGGLELESVLPCSTTVSCDPRWFPAGYPLHMGKYDLSPKDKLNAIIAAREKYFQSINSTDLPPIRTNTFTFILRKK